MEKDQRELLLEFNAHNVRFLIVGGYALSHYTPTSNLHGKTVKRA
jgi:hypothetical protein